MIQTVLGAPSSPGDTVIHLCLFPVGLVSLSWSGVERGAQGAHRQTFRAPAPCRMPEHLNLPKDRTQRQNQVPMTQMGKLRQESEGLGLMPSSVTPFPQSFLLELRHLSPLQLHSLLQAPRKVYKPSALSLSSYTKALSLRGTRTPHCQPRGHHCSVLTRSPGVRHTQNLPFL